MIKNRTAQLIFLTIACTIGLLGIVASFGLFNYTFSWDFYIFFTNISNYLCVGVLMAELIQTAKKKTDSYVSVNPLIKFIGMLGILLTFLVFNIMLAPARDARLNFAVGSICFHVLIPVLYIADWVLFYERKKVKWTYPLLSALFPLAYVGFVFSHAASLNFDSTIHFGNSTTPLIYPYFFLNIDDLGFLGVIKWVGILLTAFVVLGYIFFGLDKLSRKQKTT